jgi:hypothetical protein
LAMLHKSRSHTLDESGSIRQPVTQDYCAGVIPSFKHCRSPASQPRTPAIKSSPTTTAASPGSTRRSTARRSPTSTRPSDSTPSTPPPKTTAASPGTTSKEYDKALADFNEAIRLDPKLANAYIGRGEDWRAKQEYDKALADDNEAIRLDPKHNLAYNYRAWLWATCPDAKYRDGQRAVESATKACELTDWKDRNRIDTLAAAYAEAGDFAAAVKWQARAIELLTTDAETRDELLYRLELYRLKQPYREKNR